jgi:hypothetical protein
MEHLHGWFVAAAYVIGLGILAADALLPRFRMRSLLRAIQLRERRSDAASKSPATAERTSP